MAAGLKPRHCAIRFLRRHNPWTTITSRWKSNTTVGVACSLSYPRDATDDEIAYFKTLVPRVEQGLLEMVDPDTWAVVFSCRPTLMH